MKTLAEIYEDFKGFNNGDKGTTHSYIEVYQELLEPYRNNSSVLEIGIADGDSIRMWETYFIDSIITGIDLVNYNPKALKDSTRLFFFSSTNQMLVNSALKDDKFDVIIDDGSHRAQDQVATYKIFKTRIKKNGIYIIEDVDKIDEVAPYFLKLDDTKDIQIIDRRKLKERSDDVLIIFKDKVK